MKKIKSFILPIFFLILTVIVIYNNDIIVEKIANLLEKNPKVVLMPANDYAKDYDFAFVQRTKDFKPYSRGELLNVFFSVINNGWENFTFYCPVEYKDCLSDLEAISNDKSLLTHINNFAHPYNSFQSIETSYSESGEVNLKINKIYTQAMIDEMEIYVDNLLMEVGTNLTLRERIKKIHDHILNNADYDMSYNPASSNNEHASNTAYGVFFEGYGICSGFTDAMAIFLERLGVHNFKVASEKHVWNAALINDEWFHLDATWNAPTDGQGRKTLWDRYFLIRTNRLYELNTKTPEDHEFDLTVYLEFKGV